MNDKIWFTLIKLFDDEIKYSLYNKRPWTYLLVVFFFFQKKANSKKKN